MEKFKEEYSNVPKGEPKTRYTYDRDGNEYVWMSGDATRYTVENFLKDTRGIDTNQNGYFY